MSLWSSLPRLLLPSLRSPLSSSSSAQASSSRAVLPAFRPFSSSAVLELVRKPTKIKLKTHKGAAKRWLAVSNGEFKRSKAGKVHLNGHMSPTRLNRLGLPMYARPAEKKTLRRLLPYA